MLNGTSIDFQAVPNPVGSAFPTGEPVWSGTSGATGTGATQSVMFNTTSASASDYKTVIATAGNSSVTVNVVVYELTGVFTPQDNFTGRSTTTYGISEKVNLSFTATPNITASQVGGLTWKITSGSGSVTNSTDGTSVFTASETSGTVTLKLEIEGGPSQSFGPSYSKTITSPTGGYLRQTPGTNLLHHHDKCSVGFYGQGFLLPKDVSFINISFFEGTATATASGYYASNAGAVHGNGSPMSVTNCNTSTGCFAFDDIVFTAGSNEDPPFANGEFLWPIPWIYVTGTGSQNSFYTANHHQVADQSGKATIEKAGAGPFSKVPSDPESY